LDSGEEAANRWWGSGSKWRRCGLDIEEERRRGGDELMVWECFIGGGGPFIGLREGAEAVKAG
jgi:hypothetical protein